MRHPRLTVAAALGTATALASSLTEPAVAETPIPIVNQGERIYIQNTNGREFQCTVGYVDRDNGRLWTAGHCAPNGSQVFNHEHQPIGILEHRYNVSENVEHLQGDAQRQAVSDYFFYDLSAITLTHPESAGANTYSGDRTHIPEVGEEVCRFGATSNQIYCAVIFNVTDHLVYAADLNTQAGDSGGPAWVPGRGFIGHAVGSFKYRTNRGREVAMSIIHREDLAKITPEYNAELGFNHYKPTEDELIKNSYVLKNKVDSFGSNLPSPSEFSKILRQHEKDIIDANNRANKAENAHQDLINKTNPEAYEREIKKLHEQQAQLRQESNTNLIIAVVAAVAGFVLAALGWLMPRHLIPGR
ncbi:MAG: hypothetical protein Q4A31_05400 [Corynebacterium sp.]|uniref:hypothetical protein n=1 Tax=Corynebacterium sp. TaxID=1720 RepID=UPI0026DCC34F|nr:hypothetical protein [Corynebacterium sp.]MDO4761334.1 hypothetical protein [Corynebacterium sp.]